MYRALTKILKNKNGLTSLTKKLLSNSNNIPKFSTVKNSKAFSTETGTRFNKFADRTTNQVINVIYFSAYKENIA